MKEVLSNPDLVAYCGLYCGACRSYLRDKCPGCHENEKAKWCKIRVCCIDNKYLSCADCQQYDNLKDCKLFNNFMAKIFSFIFRSDRPACIQQIRELGIQGHADNMAETKRQSIKR
ncbi:MAG TPA: DUF3795 domain-containing protein [Dehalococcoidia bacterium]|nr:DUF3795 domain-containing protein [Dehalococcoidia bacterium]